MICIFFKFCLVVLFLSISLAHTPNYYNKPPAVNDSAGYGGFGIPQLKEQLNKTKQERRESFGIQPHQHSNFTSFKTSKTNKLSAALSSLQLPSKSSSDEFTGLSTNSSLKPAYVYEAVMPIPIDPVFNKLGNPHIKNATTNPSLKNDADLSKKIIGSSIVTSVSVILNGNGPEFTDALGQKVPKPQPSLQVASPINLLNPDRYEFFTFDDHGELVKRLMTIEEIKSIVANGDGEGPSIIHHGPIDERNSEKNVQDIVNSVQSVLSKEVKSNRNSSIENLAVFDTPNVSSTWSMILPAILGNTGSVDVFSHQKPHQIIMTPDSVIIETSTKKILSPTTRKSKPKKKKPGQKRKYTTTTTEITPQVVQEELDSKESVYTGMQQYQHLAATMQNYDSFSQFHMQPIYQKLPAIEATTRRVFTNNHEIVKNPITIPGNDEYLISENLAKNPISIQHTPLHHFKTPNSSQLTTKQPQAVKQKNKRKPIMTSTPPIPSSTSTSSLPAATSFTTPETTTSATAELTSTKTVQPKKTVVPSKNSSSTSAAAGSTTNLNAITSTAKPSTGNKKKPTRTPINAITTSSDRLSQTPKVTAEKRNPYPKPHRHRPTPTQHYTEYPHTGLTTGFNVEAHQEISNNKLQHLLNVRIRPKPYTPNHSTNFSSNTSTTASTTVLFSPIPTPTTNNTSNFSLVIEDFPGLQKTVQNYKDSLIPNISPTDIYEDTTSAEIPATTATSGYPVPSYTSPLDELENINQFKKQNLLSTTIIQYINKPPQQGVQTLQSFEQIIQTLKYPVQTSEQLHINVDKSQEEVSLKHIKYDNLLAAETTPIAPTDFEITSYLSYEENTSIKYENEKFFNNITERPTNNFINNTLNDVSTNNPIDEEINYNTETISFKNLMQVSFTTTEQPEKLIKENTEYQSALKIAETQNFSIPSNVILQLTVPSGNEASTVPLNNKDHTRLPVLFSKKEGSVTKGNKYPGHQIFMADLKHQFNKEVITPSQQINMSDFQTQTATVASTFIDGGNTLFTDYNNETSDKNALLLSDVNYRISNTNEESKKPVTNFNNNRFSNQVQLDLSFYMNSTMSEYHIPISTDKPNIQPNCKPTFERNSNPQSNPLEAGSKNRDPCFGTTEVPDITTLREFESQEFYTELDEKIVEQQTTEKRINTYQTELNDEFVFTPIDILVEKDKTSAAMNKPIITSTVVYSQQQKLKDERYPLFEPNSFVGTTTIANRLFKESTTFFDEKSSIQNLNANNVTGFEIHAAIASEKEYKTETTTENDQMAITETCAEKFELVDAETVTNTLETKKTLDWITTKSKNTLSTEGYKLDNYAAEIGMYNSLSNRTSDNLKDEISTQSTPEERLTEEKATVKINERYEYTTAIYDVSEETSAELNAMISEEDETNDPVNEDTYIKLGETTTIKLLEADMQSLSTQVTKQDAVMLSSPKPIQPLLETKFVAQTNLLATNFDQQFEEADEEDEFDQFGYHFLKQPNHISSTPLTKIAAITKASTPSKTQATTTTRHLNTRKPVSYFNKQSAYALHQNPVDSLYKKNSPQTVYSPPKIVTYSTPSTQQRPMHQTPQTSNLLGSTSSTRPPIKLEPAPFNSKGLEASLANLDEDILAFSKLCNELAFSYWKSITSQKISSARSFVMSPFALTSMLAIVFLGARGSTSGEMNDLLKLDDMIAFNPHLVFRNITDAVEKSVNSHIATTAFVREIYSDRANGKILQFFKEKTLQLYSSHVEEVNFYVVNDIIRRRTNLLVKRHTMGKVLEYLRTNSIWVNGPLATVTANLFQTDCSHGFTKGRDGEIFFQVHPSVRQRRFVPIPAVLYKSGFTAGYEPHLDATVVAFGRIQDTTSMIYVKPGHLTSMSPSDNLDRLEKQLIKTAISGNAWHNLLISLMDQPGIEVQIPRFSHRSFINATTGLKKIGFKELFKPDYADLGGLTGSSSRDIYLSDMIQINTFSTCGEEKIADHHHIEMYPAPPLRKRNKDAHSDDEQDSSEAGDFGSTVKDPVLGRGFYDDLLHPKYLELPLPLRPRQARVPEAPILRFDIPFLYFVRHNPTGMILFMGRFNPRLLP